MCTHCVSELSGWVTSLAPGSIILFTFSFLGNMEGQQTIETSECTSCGRRRRVDLNDANWKRHTKSCLEEEKDSQQKKK